jgi:hypothetical protein
LTLIIRRKAGSGRKGTLVSSHFWALACVAD